MQQIADQAELWQVLLLLARTLLLAVLLSLAAAAAVAGVLVSRAAPATVAPWLEILALIVTVVVTGWVWARLALAAPMTFASGKLVLFASWAVTKGRAWLLFRIAVLSLLYTVLAEVAALIVLLGVAEFAADLGRWKAADITAALAAPVDPWTATPFVLLGGLALSVAAAFITAVAIAPWAEAYQEIAGAPAEAPPARAPARFARPPAYSPPGQDARLPPAWAAPMVLGLLMSASLGLETVALIFGLVIAGLAGAAPAAALTSGWGASLTLTAGLDILMVVMVLAWVRAAERRPLASAGFTRRARLGDSAWFGAGLFWALALGAGLAIGGDPSHLPGPQTLAGLDAGLLVEAPVVLATILLFAFTEEVLFRGWLLSTLAPRIGPFAALMLSSTVFAALHVMPWELGQPARLVSFLAYIATGAAFGAVALNQRQIWSSTALHAGYNAFIVFTALAGQGQSPPGVWTDLTDQRRGATDLDQAWILLTVNGLASVLLVIRWLRLRRTAAPVVAPAAEPTAATAAA